MKYWVIKARPDSNDFSKFPARGRKGRWYAARLPKDWTPNDLLFIWAAAPLLRVIGIAKLVEANDGFNKGSWNFKVRYLSNPFEGPTIEELRRSATFRGASFLKQGPSGTIFSLTPRQGLALRSMVDIHLPRVRSKMTVWRMSFRCGDRGYEMWPHCFESGVAAITYESLCRVDLARYPHGEPKKLWSQLAPSQSASLRRIAYEMKKGDVIYVKQGPKIVGRGRVTGKYKFDSKFRLFCPDYKKMPWSHQVPVAWDKNFDEIDILLGAEPTTVLPLTGERLRKLEAAIKSKNKEVRRQEALEGATYKAETIFRKRNRALIIAKKANSDGKCEICDFYFEKLYGSLSRDCLIAHHINPIGKRKGASKTTLNDIALLCPNCHSAAHTQDPPIIPGDLRKRLSR